MKRSYTRQELYDLIWSTPISKLAEQFELSDRGLAKTCARHQIPVPGREYWAKLEAGQRATKTPLWNIDNPGLEIVHVGEGKIARSSYAEMAIKATQAAQKIVAEEDGHTRASTSTPAPKPVAETIPAKPPSKLHPSVAAFGRELLNAKPAHKGNINVRWVQVPPEMAGRVLRLLSLLAYAFEPFGISFEASENRVQFSAGGTSVDFQITSPKKRVARPSKHSDWTFCDYVPVGRLSFQMFGRAEGSQKNWADTETRQIEEQIDRIVQSFRVNLVVQKELDEKERLAREKREHMAHRRALAQKREEREQSRWSFLSQIADMRREILNLRETISLVPTGYDLPPDYVQMISWALVRLAKLEARTTVEAIQESLSADRLFPDPDELHDPEGDPPPKQHYWDD
jgi:hypothetical protein